MDIEWVDELPGGNNRWSRERREQTRQFADDVRKRPGQWATYPWPLSKEGARSMASRIANGKLLAFASGFQAVSRGDRCYVKYTGGDQ